MSSMMAALLRAASIVHAAIHIDGSRAVMPLAEDDPSPIVDPTVYHSDQHNCPLPCVDYGNTHGWIPYFSVDRLHRCEEPMLLQFSITQLLDNPESTVLIRSCTLSSNSSSLSLARTPMENPKKSKALFEKSLEIAPACVTTGTGVQEKLQLATDGLPKNGGGDIFRLLDGMERFFDNKDNCDETFLFSYHHNTVASIYIGPGLGKATVRSALKALASRLQAKDTITNTVVQLCGQEREPERVFGISIDTSGNLAAVQKMALHWSKGKCVSNMDFKESLAGVRVMDIAGVGITADNTTLSHHTTSSATHDTREYNSYIHKLQPWKDIKHSFLRTHVKRDVCRYIKVVPGDGCGSLVMRCGIPASDFLRFNPKKDLCATLMPGDYVCCSDGTRYTPPKPPAPGPQPDGTCARHLVQNGDTCAALALRYGTTVDDLEKWNKGKTWAWTECKDLLVGYYMCLSDGTAPLPAPQQGAQCGPLVPGTEKPKDSTISFADLNPCPLKACCSNWGYCGVFPGHCEIHKPKGGGPGSKEKGYQNTCVSNCGNEIKQNSGPPAAFQRIGYYEAFGLERSCLWLKASDANTDGSYTHIHWGFADIQPGTWKPIINDTKGQWKEFKALQNVKRIVSFGGWGYSTEPATYNILRLALIDNYDTFASNLAKFATDEGIDGIDIDWEYPGAPDIIVDGKPIGQKGDGAAYLRFLRDLKGKLGPDKSASIAAPASYWYLMAFPIDSIAKVVDYIVYMTYDLHGQWDYGNANAFDMCPSGKCIRSHVNLTETRNALSMVTKAGVPNNKIFVGESSYGRSFHMAQAGCWGPLCDFTGSRTQSDANPGRCTKSPGYVALAEIDEIIKRGENTNVFHDESSNTDVLLYKGDYVSYMTPVTKDSRRAAWKSLNFAGSIDWAVDLQRFTNADFENIPKRPGSKTNGCISGKDVTLDTGTLCEFSCYLGFCPESLCTCLETGPLNELPPEQSNARIIGLDEHDVDLNRLCKFSCKYGFCPGDICTTPVDWGNEGPPSIDDGFDYEDARRKNLRKCMIYRNAPYDTAGDTAGQCYGPCRAEIEEAKEAGRSYNYGCVGSFPLGKEIPWQKPPGTRDYVVQGQCFCDNAFVNWLAETVVEAIIAAAQIGCFILMSTLKFVLDVGSALLPGPGKAITAALDNLLTAAQLFAYVYSKGEDPAGAFEWWLSPCGGSDLVPEDLRKGFEILNQVGEGVSSFRKPKKIGKGSGRKGDAGNPRAPKAPRPQPPPKKPGSGNGVQKRCRIPPSKATQRLGFGKNTVRFLTCVGMKTETDEMIVTSIAYAPNAQATKVTADCDKAHSQACFHYSSAIKVNPHWATLTCPPEAATTAHRMDAGAVTTWSVQHNGNDWQNAMYRQSKFCQRDEYPPAYLLGANDPARLNSGKNAQGQLIRWVPAEQNSGAGQNWKGACLKPPLQDLSDDEFIRKVKLAPGKDKLVVRAAIGATRTYALISVTQRPEFSFSSWGQSANPPRNDGLEENPCWPSSIAAADPGFALLTYDPFYRGKAPPYDYKAPYVKGSNGS